MLKLNTGVLQRLIMLFCGTHWNHHVRQNTQGKVLAYLLHQHHPTQHKASEPDLSEVAGYCVVSYCVVGSLMVVFGFNVVNFV